VLRLVFGDGHGRRASTPARPPKKRPPAQYAPAAGWSIG